MKKTGAVIVAAGLSSRMHDFKPMLPYGNSTISLHNVTMLKNMGLDPIVVVTGFRGDELEAHLFLTGVRFIKNERFRETQMFDSVKLGVEAIVSECDRILIIPMDMPAILPETYRQVLNTEAPVVRTKYEDKAGHPLILRCDVARQLMEYEGDNGLKGALEESGLEICDVLVTDEGVRKDCDTPEQYKELIEWNYKRGGGYPVKPKVAVSLMANQEFFSSQTAQLLEAIDKCGSRQKACEIIGVSYSKGTSLINNAEAQLGYPLVSRWTGGSGGGGSKLTEEGKRILNDYNRMVADIQHITEQKYDEYLKKEFK